MRKITTGTGYFVVRTTYDLRGTTFETNTTNHNHRHKERTGSYYRVSPEKLKWMQDTFRNKSPLGYSLSLSLESRGNDLDSLESDTPIRSRKRPHNCCKSHIFFCKNIIIISVVIVLNIQLHQIQRKLLHC